MDNLLLNNYFDKFHSKQVEDWYRDFEAGCKRYIDTETVRDSITTIIKNKIYEIGFKSILIDFHNSFDLLDEVDEKKYLELYIQIVNPSKNEILFPKIESAIRDTLSYIAEIINHYIKDYKQIKNKFNLRTNKITSILINQGDTHNKGKSVAQIKLKEEIIVYKPKDLGPDIFYYEIIKFYNAKKGKKLYIPTILNKKNYGWQEFIKQTLPRSIEDITNYYSELGAHSCFLYLLQANDIHFENIISMNKHPVFIDLETIFQSELSLETTNPNNNNINFTSETILSTLLFDYAATPTENMNLFIGGTTNPIRQTFYKELLVDLNTDKMRLVNSIHKNADVSNIPLLNKEYQEIYDYIDDYSNGFLECYTYILQNKDFLEEKIIETKNFSIRYVLRATYVYAKFIDALKDPNRLTVNRKNELFEIIKKTNTSIIKSEEIHELEFLDIQDYDVPFFISYLDSNSLMHPKSGAKIDHFLLKEPRQKVINKLHTFSEKDCNYQLDLIKMAISSYYENTGNNIRKNYFLGDSSTEINKTKKEVLINELLLIKEKLLLNHNYIQAISLRHDQRGNNVLSTMPLGIYDGLAGLGLLLAAEQKVLGINNENEIQKINYTINMLYKADTGTNMFSIYNGKASYFKYFLEMKRINEKFTVNLKANIIDFCLEILSSNISRAPLDYIGGIAGLLSLLIEFKKEVNDKTLDKCILTLKNAIIEKIKNKDGLLFWSSDSSDSKSLAGFAHGITGINYSLSKIIFHYPHLENELVNVINKTSLYEDRLFDEDRHCWIDNREGKQEASNTWCNGNSGILLGRSLIEQNTGLSMNYFNETKKLVLQENLMHKIDDSVCHGSAGNLIILNTLNTNNSSLRGLSDHLYQALGTSSIKSGYKYNTNTLSFFLGKAGVIYSILHDIDNTLPSILI